MATCQSIVVEEHGSLKFEILPEEWQLLDLSLFLVFPRTVLRQRLNRIYEPQIARLQYIFVSVDLSLLERPFRQGFCMRPHGHSRRDMD